MSHDVADGRGPGAHNPHLADLGVDTLYHLGLDTTCDLQQRFADTKFVLLGGSATRMHKTATLVAGRLGVALPTGGPVDLIAGDRYSLYKVGPVVCANHGMGMPSISILLHELAKLFHHAGADDPCYIRIGTSGGLGLVAGSVVVTSACLDGALDPCYTYHVLGKTVSMPAVFHEPLCRELVAEGTLQLGPVVFEGKTMSAVCFYNGQARLDGAWCDHTNADKQAFMKEAHSRGVRNIEMESLYLAAFAQRLGIRAACVCVTLINRLEGDQVDATEEMLSKWVERPIELVTEYVAKSLATSEATGAAPTSERRKRKHVE